ncbi:hypothetical protein M9H77_22629 [Catharanthus roseus]|uniref:Uncharacterized protein n=1 Tax=Catharanthus roseus TaxID=4058 RepID=A0ACC0ARQ9_CATRO|nr:hypothetical protein M9H77_22629 [Catharanthus roseus]
MRAIGQRCGIIGILLRIKPSPNRIRGTELRDREDGELGSIWVPLEQVLRGVPQASEGGEERRVREFPLGQFWEKFHEISRKAEEDAEALGTAMPDYYQLMAIVAGGVSRSRLYGASSEAAHFIAESS